MQLARLLWRPASGGPWQEGDGRLAITAGTSAYLSFFNQGVVPATLLLDEGEIDQLPDWVKVDALCGRPIHLEPGGALESVEIELRESATATQDDLTARDAELTFHSSAGARPLRLTLVLTRQPWVQPKASRYLFLPYETLSQELSHQVEIHNAAAEGIELLDISLVPSQLSSPLAGARQISAATLLYWDYLDFPLTIAPGEIWMHEIRLKMPEHKDALVGFATQICYRLKAWDEEIEVSSRLEGILGRGPSLEFHGSSTVDAAAPSREVQDFFKIRNPGHVPVEVKSIDVFSRSNEQLEVDRDGDWLRFSGLGPGDILAPGTERLLQVAYAPDFRQAWELQEELNKRVIRIRHDGWQAENGRFIEAEVFAHFGRAEERMLGIDFGTSNSVACLVGEETGEGYPLVLDFGEGNQPMSYLPSLMFFDGRKSVKTDAERFLYGEVAKSSQSMEPANLVCSIKTVVADGSKETYEFRSQGADGSVRYLELPVQRLLNAFIYHLRSKAEQGVLDLHPRILMNEGLNERRVVFRSAVFSHPVEVTESMKMALWQAAQRAGINTSIQTLEQFFEDCCIDEATAAVLAYVDRMVADYAAERSNRELKDLERILCIDIGGGTTDIAAVSVANLASFVKNPTSRVSVDLLSRKGDRHFAGDTLDRLLAEQILLQIEEQSRKTGSPILVREVLWAVQASSYASYQRTFGERLRNDPRLSGILETTDAYSIYRHASNVVKEAERAKRLFSVEEAWSQTFSGARWPRRPGADSAVEGAELQVSLGRADFEKIVKEALLSRYHLIDSVVKGAGWEWSSVSTLLLTGQSMRSPLIRQHLRDYVRKQMGEESAEGLFVAEPHDGSENKGDGFDPKACVAIGAALWGISRTRGDAWLKLNKPVLGKLTFDLAIKAGRLFSTIPGLEAGTVLPAQGALEFPTPRKDLVLFRDGTRFAEFRNFKPSTSIKVCMKSLVEIFVEIDGNQHSGEILR